MKKLPFILFIIVDSIIFLGCKETISNNKKLDPKKSFNEQRDEKKETGIEVGFQEVTIANQTWMKKNLDLEKFSNGDLIPQVKSYEEWKAACDEKKPAWCYFNFDSSYGMKYGKLYNLYVVRDSRRIEPDGWKIPTFSDFEILEKNVKPKTKNKINFNEFNSALTSGFQLKSIQGWRTYNKQIGNGNDKYGFNALPGGYVWLSNISNSSEYKEGISFEAIGENAFFWTSDDEKFHFYLSNGEYNSDISGYIEPSATFCCMNDFGFYVRLVKK
jgi:uncharacterized protein (TIGR02145 family)